jgi:uncharacterized protein (TIGR00730 family)
MGARASYLEAAQALGTTIAERGLRLVYGGARVGLMGAVADAALAAGGIVIGVIPGHMADREIAHGGLSELHVTGSMHERKAMMASLADAFVALPGGFGTLDELAEALTWTQLGLQHKPCGLLDVGGFYSPLLAFVAGAVKEGFIRPQHRELLMADTAPRALLDRLAAWAPAGVP